MYLEHFGLAEPPFTITPHTEFFFAGANRGATLEALIYAITHGEGIVKVSGEVGSGKTMLCRVLMERLPENVETIYLAIPSLNRDEMLTAICADLGVEPGSHTPMAQIKALQEHLLNLHAQGKRVVALIDEAHAMPLESLEEIRLLSNLETNRSKLLQIVLFGQPELDEHLAKPQMRQLRERITHSFGLSPLTLEDVQNYLRHRLSAAGYRGVEVFNPACVKLIGKASEGLSRRVNIIADKSLLAAFSNNAHAVSTAHVDAAIKDCDFATMEPTGAVRRTWRLVTAALAVGLVIGALAMSWLTGHSPSVPLAPLATAAHKPDVTPVPAVTNSSMPSVTEPPAAASGPAPIVNQAPASLIQPAVAQSTSAGEVQEKAPAPPVATVDSSSLRQRLVAASPWLKNEPGSNWVIQLMLANAGETAQLQQFIAESERLLGDGRIHVYPLRVNGTQKISVVFGSFPSREAAFKAMSSLPPLARQFKPYLRTVQLISNEAEYDRRQDASS